MAEHWLKMEEAAAKALVSPTDKNEHTKEFYEAKVQTAEFYFSNILPRTETLVTTMFTPVDTIMQMKEEHFSFDHALGTN